MTSTPTRAEKIAALREALGLDGPRHARHNLDGALIDIEHNDSRADAVCVRTIRRVRDQLAEAERILADLEAGEQGWRPIAEAPATKKALLFFPKTEGRRGVVLCEMIRVGAPAEYPYRPPTHWMPLPQPPAERREAAPSPVGGADPPRKTDEFQDGRFLTEGWPASASAPTAGTTWLVDPPGGSGWSKGIFDNRMEAEIYAAGCPPHTRIVERPTPTAGDAVTQECVLRECWYDLVEKDDRTSPEEYPDHALITREELGIYLQEAAQAERAALLEKIREPSEELATRISREFCGGCPTLPEGSVPIIAKLLLEFQRQLAAHLSGDQP